MRPPFPCRIVEIPHETPRQGRQRERHRHHAGIVISGLNANTTTLTIDDNFYASVGTATTNSVNTQAVRAGGNEITVTFMTDDIGVGLLTDGVNSGNTVTAVIPVGSVRSPTTVAAGGTAHNPVGVGTATITATAPGVISQPNATQTVTINP